MDRLLFFDIDGILAFPRQSPSLAKVATIRRARVNGHKVFLCTGRTFDSIPKSVSDIGFDGGIFSAGGLVMVDVSVISVHFMADWCAGFGICHTKKWVHHDTSFLLISSLALVPHLHCLQAAFTISTRVYNLSKPRETDK